MPAAVHRVSGPEGLGPPRPGCAERAWLNVPGPVALGPLEGKDGALRVKAGGVDGFGGSPPHPTRFEIENRQLAQPRGGLRGAAPGPRDGGDGQRAQPRPGSVRQGGPGPRAVGGGEHALSSAPRRPRFGGDCQQQAAYGGTRAPAARFALPPFLGVCQGPQLRTEPMAGLFQAPTPSLSSPTLPATPRSQPPISPGYPPPIPQTPANPRPRPTTGLQPEPPGRACAWSATCTSSSWRRPCPARGRRWTTRSGTGEPPRQIGRAHV